MNYSEARANIVGKGLCSIIIGTGSYIPTRAISNKDFLDHQFYNSKGETFDKTNPELIKKFQEITGITERRYVTDDLVTSDIAFHAATNALESSGIDKETLDYIIVAHNFGDVRIDNKRSDFVPSIAARVKQKLNIVNPKTIAYDLPFGCPGWLQGMIQTDYYLKSGDAKRTLVIGAETLSRISDPHDRDSMIYADGAGAAVVEAMTVSDDTEIGILAHAARSDALENAYMLRMGKSFNPNYEGKELFLKMDGHRLYVYALRTVPKVVKETLEKAGLSLGDVDHVLLHQANGKMDHAILRHLYALYGEKEVRSHIMPMIISWLGNSSVATLPTLLDFLVRGKLNSHKLKKGDIVTFASVGAGMNINSMVYRMP
jgi:3-oxoacyl-[acyl-carrier-protein] synthase-3